MKGEEPKVGTMLSYIDESQEKKFRKFIVPLNSLKFIPEDFKLIAQVASICYLIIYYIGFNVFSFFIKHLEEFLKMSPFKVKAHRAYYNKGWFWALASLRKSTNGEKMLIISIKDHKMIEVNYFISICQIFRVLLKDEVNAEIERITKYFSEADGSICKIGSLYVKIL